MHPSTLLSLSALVLFLLSLREHGVSTLEFPLAEERGLEDARSSVEARAEREASSSSLTSTSPSSSLLVDLDLDAAFAASHVDCPRVPHHVAKSFSLSKKDVRDICWHSNLADAVENSKGIVENVSSSRGVPEGVECEERDWCDSSSRCTRVCSRGTVRIPSWLSIALRTQEALSARLPLCLAALPGSHNSAITIADGYGALDPAFRAFFSWVRWVQPDAPLRTNDQILSLTDQLNLGIRAVELDVHFVSGKLRIAHCGGFHAPPLDRFVAALNAVARLLRRPFKWDVETLGCSPSLSSIPAAEQREFGDAVSEVGSWLKSRLEERDEKRTNSTTIPLPPPPLLVLYLDDQPDLLKWGKIPELLSTIEKNLPEGSIYTPADHEEWTTKEKKREENEKKNGEVSSLSLDPSSSWPSALELAALNKSVIVVSGTDYGEAMSSLAFPRKQGGSRDGDSGDDDSDGGSTLVPCGWAEPALRGFRGTPQCDAACSASDGCVESDGGQFRAKALRGRLLRVLSCELQYGPLNCDFTWKQGNDPVLDETNLPRVVACGINMPSPDTVTPRRTAAGVWTWAEGHPPTPATPAPNATTATTEEEQQDEERSDETPSSSHAPGDRESHKDRISGLLRWIRRLLRRRRGGAEAAAEASSSIPFGFPWPPRPRPPLPPSGKRGHVLCGALSSSDGRWRARNCTDALPTACRDSTVVLWDLCRNTRNNETKQRPLWLLPPAGSLPAQRGECGGGGGGRATLMSTAEAAEPPILKQQRLPPSGYSWEAPRAPPESAELARMLKERGFEGAWLPTSELSGWSLEFPS